MKTQWSTIPLGEIAVHGGGSINPAKFQDEIFELYSIPAYGLGKPDILPGKDIGSAKKKVRPNDVLLSRIVPHIQRVWVVGNKGNMRQIASGEWIIYRSNKFHPPFLRYTLLTKRFHAQFMRTISGVGGSLLRARPDIVAQIEIPLPPLAKQKRIAAILAKADAIRRKRRQAIQLADEFLRSVFLDMFGDPAKNPKGWQRKKIGQLGKVVTGNTPSRQIQENYGEHIEWIKSDNINTPSHILTKAEEALSEAGEKLGRTVPANSTLVTCIAGTPECIGNAALADRKVAFNQQINAIVPFDNVYPYFLYMLVIISKKIIQRASTNSMKGMVSKGIFQEIELISPPFNLQKKFGSHFYAYLNYLDKQGLQLKESDNLFNSLCQKAFRGEL